MYLLFMIIDDPNKVPYIFRRILQMVLKGNNRRQHWYTYYDGGKGAYIFTFL